MLQFVMGAGRDRISKTYVIYIFTLLFVNLLPVLAPVFLRLGESSELAHNFAKLIYFVYSFTCHQFDHRSFHLFDYQYAWCARDVGIWLGILLAAIAIYFRPHWQIRWYWLLPFVVPIALDGGIQTIATVLQVNPYAETGMPLYISGNLTRFVTGAFFGIGLSLWMSPLLLNLRAVATLKFGLRALAKRTAVFFFPLALAYLVVLVAWFQTSTVYQPLDPLDAAPKHPAADFYTRRAHAVCPSGVEDFASFGCFLEGE